MVRGFRNARPLDFQQPRLEKWTFQHFSSTVLEWPAERADCKRNRWNSLSSLGFRTGIQSPSQMVLASRSYFRTTKSHVILHDQLHLNSVPTQKKRIKTGEAKLLAKKRTEYTTDSLVAETSLPEFWLECFSARNKPSCLDLLFYFPT